MNETKWVRGVQASEQEHKADCNLLRLPHLQLKHARYGYHENAYVAEEIDDADPEVELHALE